MADPAPKPRMTAEEYLAWEEEQPEKHVFYYGEVFPVFPEDEATGMAGGTRTHALLTARILAALSAGLRDAGCLVYSSDLRVALDAGGHYVYPDVTVTCGEEVFDGETLLNPALVVEVLSGSTEAYDRGAKLEAYRRLPSLREVVLVAQDRRHVEVYRRDGTHWLLFDADADAAVGLSTTGTTLHLGALYAGIGGL